MGVPLGQTAARIGTAAGEVNGRSLAGARHGRYRREPARGRQGGAVAAEPGGFLTVPEVADLLRLKARRVYALARAGVLPSRRVTGRLLFARGDLEGWLRDRSPPAVREPPAVLVGSHDPLLEWALRESGSGISSFCDGSLDGLARMARGAAAMAGVHLAEDDGNGWNRRHVLDRLPQAPVVLLEWAWREKGLVVPAANPLRIAGIRDLAGRRIVVRQEQAGSQLLLERLLARDGVAASPAPEVARSEADAALAVADGKADAAFGLAGMARQFRLGFVPVVRERFDLVVFRRAYFEPPVQCLVALAASGAFARKAEEMGGYDLSGQFRVHHNGP
jgi:putative molybdopterin biosynthesis protein